ncbi:MAG: DUF493 domain-containing protein [Gammaproteobacteria bacterium]|nr:DUF493 domain-containing protein [Gammaproteobacteria bacterium]
MPVDIKSTGEKPPKIEFPCLYPIKIIGYAVIDFEETVLTVIERYAGPVAKDLIKAKSSRKNNYLSITVTIAATGEEQLHSIFQDLKKIESVKMVL